MANKRNITIPVSDLSINKNTISHIQATPIEMLILKEFRAANHTRMKMAILTINANLICEIMKEISLTSETGLPHQEKRRPVLAIVLTATAPQKNSRTVVNFLYGRAGEVPTMRGKIIKGSLILRS